MSHYETVVSFTAVGIPGMLRACHTIANGLDEAEVRLDRLRINAGFNEDWSPYYDRKSRSGVSEAVRWSEKAGGLNGVGDMQRFLGELASGLDTVLSKLGELEALTATDAKASTEPEKRKPGRPRKDAAAA